MKNVLYATIVLTILFTGCKNYGTKLEFNGGELYYTKSITEQEANDLGSFLVAEDFFAGDPISVLIDKADGVYEFKMVSKEGSENQEGNVVMAQSFSQTISSQVFNGAPVDFHFCDTYFNTKLEVPFLAK